MTAPISKETIKENPTVTPSTLTKNKSTLIISELRFENMKKDIMRRIKNMK